MICFCLFLLVACDTTDLSVSYQSGPLKRIERCVAKAETDYSDAKYPTSAKILDIIRCACVYDNCDDLVAGMQKVAERIGKQDTELKKVCLVFYSFFFFFPRHFVLLFVFVCLSLHEKQKNYVFVFVFVVCCLFLF